MITREKVIAAFKELDQKYFSMAKGGNKNYNEFATDYLIEHRIIKLDKEKVTNSPETGVKPSKARLLSFDTIKDTQIKSKAVNKRSKAKSNKHRVS